MKTELYNDNFQNYKRYNIPKAQLVIADIPYNVGTNFYGSNPEWYKGGDNKNGESKKAGKAAFNSDFNFNIAEYFHFCNRLLKKEPKKAVARGRSSDAILVETYWNINLPLSPKINTGIAILVETYWNINSTFIFKLSK